MSSGTWSLAHTLPLSRKTVHPYALDTSICPTSTSDLDYFELHKRITYTETLAGLTTDWVSIQHSSLRHANGAVPSLSCTRQLLSPIRSVLRKCNDAFAAKGVQEQKRPAATMHTGYGAIRAMGSVLSKQPQLISAFRPCAYPT